MTWRFDWITSWGEIWSDSFLTQWHEWMQTSSMAHVFFHPALVRAWVETYLPLRRMEPRFLVATAGDCIVFLPMVLWRRNWKSAFQRLLIPVGHSDYDYHDPIIVGTPSPDFWQAFWYELSREICQRTVEYDKVELTGIHQSQVGLVEFVEEADACPWCDLSGFTDAETFLRSLKKSLRSDIRRKERRMSEVGRIVYQVFRTEDHSAANEALNDLLFAHTRRWPQSFKAPGLHFNLVKYGLSAGLLHFSSLKVGEEVAAWHLGFIDGSRYYYYMPAYDERYAKFSPGKILLFYCTIDAIDRGLKVFDHLRGEENYKAGWTDQADHLYTLCIVRDGLESGLRNVLADQIKPAFTRLVRFCGDYRVHR